MGKAKENKGQVENKVMGACALQWGGDQCLIDKREWQVAAPRLLIEVTISAGSSNGFRKRAD